MLWNSSVCNHGFLFLFFVIFFFLMHTDALEAVRCLLPAPKPAVPPPPSVAVAPKRPTATPASTRDALAAVGATTPLAASASTTASWGAIGASAAAAPGPGPLGASAGAGLVTGALASSGGLVSPYPRFELHDTKGRYAPIVKEYPPSKSGRSTYPQVFTFPGYFHVFFFCMQ